MKTVTETVIELHVSGKRNIEIAATLFIKPNMVAMLISRWKKDAGVKRRRYERKADEDRDCDDVLDEVERGERCKGCWLLWTPRSTCTPEHCDARDEPVNKLDAIARMMTVANENAERER